MYQVLLTNEGTSQFKVKAKNYEFTIDTKGGGVTPPDALLASLASCIGVYTRKYAEGRNLELGHFTIEAHGELSHENPVCFRNIEITVAFKNKIQDVKLEESLLRFVHNCPIHNTLKNNPEVHIILT
jgi:putative redox protein